jgi:hypothetical protein
VRTFEVRTLHLPKEVVGVHVLLLAEGGREGHRVGPVGNALLGLAVILVLLVLFIRTVTHREEVVSIEDTRREVLRACAWSKYLW